MTVTGRDGQVTQADVARQAGVSRGLVSLALNGSDLVAEATRERIEDVAHRLGYRVNAQAAMLASARSGIVGLLLPDLRNPFFDAVAQSLQETAWGHGLTLLTAVSAGSREQRHRAVEAFLRLRVEGLVLVSPPGSRQEVVATAAEVPTVVIGRGDLDGAVDTVRVDEDAAAREVVTHLARCGARTVAYVGPGADDANVRERRAALSAAARAAGLDTVALDPAAATGRAVRRFLAGGGAAGAALVAHNDLVALDTLAVLRAERSDAPLASYDDTYLAQREELSLTSVVQPVGVMADEALRLLDERSGRREREVRGRTAREVRLAPRLAVRASTLAPATRYR